MNTPDPYKDRSHVYANPDLDKGKEAHPRLPDPLADHLIAAFKHKAGLGPHPGKLNRPKP